MGEKEDERAKEVDKELPISHGTTAKFAGQAKSGDREGFSNLYERIAPAVFAWATLRIHPRFRSALDPEDVVQEVWWRAMDAFARYDAEKGSFRAWLFRIATNVLNDGYRRLASRGESSDGGGKKRQMLPNELQAEATSIATSVSKNEDLKNLVDAASQMSKEDQALFVHCALEGLSAKQTAKITGLSVDVTTKRWQRLRARLKDSPQWQSVLRDLV